MQCFDIICYWQLANSKYLKYVEVNDKGVQLAHVGEVGHEIPNLWSVGGQWTMVISLHFLDLVFLGSFLRLVWWLHLSRSCVWNRDPVFPSPHHLQKKNNFSGLQYVMDPNPRHRLMISVPKLMLNYSDDSDNPYDDNNDDDESNCHICTVLW